MLVTFTCKQRAAKAKTRIGLEQRLATQVARSMANQAERHCSSPRMQNCQPFYPSQPGCCRLSQVAASSSRLLGTGSRHPSGNLAHTVCNSKVILLEDPLGL
jgi:hypothetical protein